MNSKEKLFVMTFVLVASLTTFSAGALFTLKHIPEPPSQEFHYLDNVRIVNGYHGQIKNMVTDRTHCKNGEYQINIADDKSSFCTLQCGEDLERIK